jgi:Tol biopolymer transport system component
LSRLLPILALLCSVSVVGCGGGEGKGNVSRNGPIVFVSLRGNLGVGIYRVDPDGSNLRRLAPLPTRPSEAASVSFPAASPDGKLVAFVRESIRVTKTLPGAPAFRETVLRLGVVPLSGGAVKTVPAIEYSRAPAWSPDSENILFPTQNALVAIRPSGENPQIVARLKDVEEATWSPDGKTIAFTRGFRIWLMNSDGTHTRPLTPEPRIPADIRDTRHASNPTWSPDGARVAYFDEAPFRASGDSITIVDSDGSGAHTLVKLGPYAYPHPTWSPDGHEIAFSDSRGGKAGIFTVPVAGGTAKLVVESKAIVEPSWAPAAS